MGINIQFFLGAMGVMAVAVTLFAWLIVRGASDIIDQELNGYDECEQTNDYDHLRRYDDDWLAANQRALGHPDDQPQGERHAPDRL